MSLEDKREFKRVTARFKVQYREVVEPMFQHLLSTGDFESTPLDELADEDVFETSTTDVSQGGLGLGGDLRLVGGRPLKPGKRLFVELFLAGHPNPVRALTTVVWTLPGARPEAGLLFMGISQRDLVRIHDYVEAAAGNSAGG